ncbi:hypothetical protein Tco_0612438 [Tanacetum coccineum]
MCDHDIQTDQNVVECDDEHVVLANLISNLKLDVDENKKIQKQLKKANTSLAHELKECKSILVETSRTTGESNKKYLGTVHFGNDQSAPILGYGDLVQGNIMINRVYYIEGLNHNLFSVGQFCDTDLEVASINGKKYILRTRLIVESIHLRFDEIKEMSETSVDDNTSGLVPQRQKVSDYDNSDPIPQLQNVSPSVDTINIQSSTEPTTPTNVNVEENNDNQAEDT